MPDGFNQDAAGLDEAVGGPGLVQCRQSFRQSESDGRGFAFVVGFASIEALLERFPQDVFGHQSVVPLLDHVGDQRNEVLVTCADPRAHGWRPILGNEDGHDRDAAFLVDAGPHLARRLFLEQESTG